MNKFLLLGLCILMFVPLVNGADGCFTNEVCTWYAYGVTGTGVNISFNYDNGTTSSEFVMSSLGSGKYLYNATHNLTGNVMGCARSYNSSGTIETACESKEISYDSSDDIIGVGFINSFWLILVLVVVAGIKVGAPGRLPAAAVTP